jgi:hypothetical protein
MDLDKFKRLRVEIFPDKGADLDGELKLELRLSIGEQIFGQNSVIMPERDIIRQIQNIFRHAEKELIFLMEKGMEEGE